MLKKLIKLPRDWKYLYSVNVLTRFRLIKYNIKLNITICYSNYSPGKVFARNCAKLLQLLPLDNLDDRNVDYIDKGTLMFLIRLGFWYLYEVWYTVCVKFLFISNDFSWRHFEEIQFYCVCSAFSNSGAKYIVFEFFKNTIGIYCKNLYLKPMNQRVVCVEWHTVNQIILGTNFRFRVLWLN